MAHLTCDDHGKRVFYAVTKNDEFIIRHRNVGDGSDATCDGKNFHAGAESYERWCLEIRV